MRELVRENRGHPIVRAHAETAVAGVAPGDALAEVLAIRAYLAARVEYRRDPNHVEWLQAPWVVLACQIEAGRTPQLDCDDLTMLSLALLEAAGFATAFRVVSHRPDRAFNHVYGLVELAPGDWRRFDLVELWRPPGAPAPTETRVLDQEVA